jgi:hypothetical protein
VLGDGGGVVGDAGDASLAGLFAFASSLEADAVGVLVGLSDEADGVGVGVEVGGCVGVVVGVGVGVVNGVGVGVAWGVAALVGEAVAEGQPGAAGD